MGIHRKMGLLAFGEVLFQSIPSNVVPCQSDARKGSCCLDFLISCLQSQGVVAVM